MGLISFCNITGFFNKLYGTILINAFGEVRRENTFVREDVYEIFSNRSNDFFFHSLGLFPYPEHCLTLHMMKQNYLFFFLFFSLILENEHVL